MKRLLLIAMALFATATAFAYNPPVGGENIFYFADPELLSGGASATGGALHVVVPASIAFNPALPALNQRTAVNASYSLAFDTKTESPWAHFIQLGAIIPTKWCVFAGTAQLSFADMNRMQLGDTFVFRAGASKDITDRLSVGANIYAGFYFAHNSDFTVGADLGAVYNFDDLGFLKNPRLGLSFINLGKPLSGSYEVQGLDGTSNAVSYPSILTPRLSFSATFFEVNGFSGSFSTDLSSPAFQNLVLDASLGFAYRSLVQVSFGWSMNRQELAHGCAMNMPSVGVRIRFVINSSKLSSRHEDWEESEMGPSLAWQDMYNGIHVISTGVQLDLGLADTAAPEIILWNGEE